MQIQLKQAEIHIAIKQYIASQGINLAGKTVVIAFTAGRKESGLTADVSIEDHDIPGYTDGDDTSEQKTPLLKVVESIVKIEATEYPSVVGIEAADTAAEDTAVKAKVSLFS